MTRRTTTYNVQYTIGTAAHLLDVQKRYFNLEEAKETARVMSDAFKGYARVQAVSRISPTGDSYATRTVFDCLNTERLDVEA